jgi:hypothetical protein
LFVPFKRVHTGPIYTKHIHKARVVPHPLLSTPEGRKLLLSDWSICGIDKKPAPIWIRMTVYNAFMSESVRRTEPRGSGHWDSHSRFESQNVSSSIGGVTLFSTDQ